VGYIAIMLYGIYAARKNLVNYNNLLFFLKEKIFLFQNALYLGIGKKVCFFGEEVDLF